MPRASTGTVEFRGNPPRWHARVTVRDEHGATHRPWVDLERPDLKNTPEDRAIAKRLAAKRAKLAKRGVYVGPEVATGSTVLLADLEDRWFALLDKDPDLKGSTAARYKTSWKATIVKQLGKRAVSTLTPPILRQWILDLRAKKSASSVRNDVASLTRVLKDAIAQRWVTMTSNPMRDEYARSAVPPMLAPEPDEIVYLTPSQLATLLASKLSDVHFGMLLVSTLTGVRDGELHGLRFGDVGKDEKFPDVLRLAIVRQAALPRASEASVTIEAPKRGSKRKIPIHPALASWLEWWKAEGWSAYLGRKVDATKPDAHKPQDEDYLFPDAAGDVWRPRAAALIRDLLKDAGLPDAFALPDGETVPFTWHALRRSFSTALGDAGVSDSVADYLMGHRPRSVRGRHYSAPPMNELARAIGLLAFALPTRAGIAAIESSQRPDESSRESSQASEASVVGDAQDAETIRRCGSDSNRRVTDLQVDQEKRRASHRASEKPPQSARATRSGTLTNGDVLLPTKPRENVDGTLWDESKMNRLTDRSDAVEAALATALARATDPAAIVAIVRELEARRRAR